MGRRTDALLSKGAHVAASTGRPGFFLPEDGLGQPCTAIAPLVSESTADEAAVRAKKIMPRRAETFSAPQPFVANAARLCPDCYP